MNKYSRLTIAIPTYKRCKSVVSLVNSIIPQLEDDDELLVVDDGSQDGTSDALGKIKRVRLVSNSTNEGMLSTWNKCLKFASRDWICMIHDDDTINSDALNTIRKACTLVQGSALIGHNYLGDNFDNCFRCRIVEPGPWSALHPLAIPSGVTIHRSIIDNLGLFNEQFQYSADIEYLSRISSKYTSIIIENPCILTFNLHDQNYEYKTWAKPDCLTQLEQIEELIVTYSGLTGDEALKYFHNKMNMYISYMLRNSYKATDKTLLRKVGIMAKNKSYLGRKNRVIAHLAALFNWTPNL
ncbi:MAG: glycosyltransferase [Cyanomargarita calcarea GSE-NOS-MK-12-04C]|jgi:glycosyltransferase involved in cell wall biosynthesis|uniref:Glycosyltransferase n=1 Tax=Cyanomargarita calcarea GSE-NOS-MK-12-04C TaxID=2839659 RepID=A0A951UTH9_9CYAN|nr:glycosyltransferase [Cyanomargarita calcarea GSE-NOS-MK-12-04C]